MSRFYKKSDDDIILEELKGVIVDRATYGCRRVTTMVNRKRTIEGRNKIDRKRVQRLMRMHGLSLPAEYAGAEETPHRAGDDIIPKLTLVFGWNGNPLLQCRKGLRGIYFRLLRP